MKSQARLRLRRPIKPEATTLKVGGKPFRCRCLANVFTRRSDPKHGEVFVCNGCGTHYAGG